MKLKKDIKMNSKPKKDLKNIRENTTYLIYYFYPEIYIIPAAKNVKDILVNYIDNYEIVINDQTFKIKAILVFYGLPLTKKDLNDLKAYDNNKEKLELLYYLKLQKFYIQHETSKQSTIYQLYQKLSRPSGIKADKINENIPILQSNYYAYLSEAFDTFLLMKNKRDVLLKSTVQITSWKQAFAYSIVNSTKILVQSLQANPRLMLIFLITILFIAILAFLAFEISTIMKQLNLANILTTTNITNISPPLTGNVTNLSIP